MINTKLWCTLLIVAALAVALLALLVLPREQALVLWPRGTL